MPVVAANPRKFTARGAPLLAKGATMELLGRAPQLWLHLKVYAEGGENSLHFHADAGPEPVKQALEERRPK